MRRDCGTYVTEGKGALRGKSFREASRGKAGSKSGKGAEGFAAMASTPQERIPKAADPASRADPGARADEGPQEREEPQIYEHWKGMFPTSKAEGLPWDPHFLQQQKVTEEMRQTAVPFKAPSASLPPRAEHVERHLPQPTPPHYPPFKSPPPATSRPPHAP